MTGAQMYEMTRELGCSIGNHMKPWRALNALERQKWEHAAFEQDLRDRVLPANLRELQKGGANAAHSVRQ